MHTVRHGTCDAGSVDAVGEYHDEPRFEQHIVVHVSIITSHHNDGLLAGHPPAHVAFVLAPVDLTSHTVEQTSVQGAE